MWKTRMAKVNGSTMKALEVLEHLAEAEGGLRLSDMETSTGFPASTTHRLLLTLIERGYVEQDADTGRYYLGAKILSLQSTGVRRMNISRMAFPTLNNIKNSLNEAVNLGIRSEKSVVYLDTLPADASLSFYSPPGTRMPLFATAMGKVLLAYLSPAVRDSLLAGIELQPLTPHTITSLPQLIEELSRVRLQGYAIDNQEYSRGIRCFAAAIRDHHGEVVASVSTTALIDRFPPERDAAIITLLTQGCLDISHQLGYLGS
jgi:IclR family transcriptional regulator, KDG regulon repressor